MLFETAGPAHLKERLFYEAPDELFVFVPSHLRGFLWRNVCHGAQFCHNYRSARYIRIRCCGFLQMRASAAPGPRGHKSIQIRFTVFQALPCAAIAFRALLSPLFYVRWKIQFPSPTPRNLPHFLVSLFSRYQTKFQEGRWRGIPPLTKNVKDGARGRFVALKFLPDDVAQDPNAC